MSESLDQTQALPVQDTEPAPPKPTLASLMVDRMVRLELENAGTQDDMNRLYVALMQTLAQFRLLLPVAIGLFAFVALEMLAVLVLVAWLVGHVR